MDGKPDFSEKMKSKDGVKKKLELPTFLNFFRKMEKNYGKKSPNPGQSNLGTV